MSVITIQPDPTAGKDSLTDSTNATTNFGTQTFLEIGYRPANSGIYRGYLQFDISPIPAGSTINSAVLSVNMYNTDENLTDSTTWALHYVTASWAEGTITHNAQPSFNGASSATATFNGNTTGWRDFTITSLVQSWLDGGITNNGVVIKQNSEAAAVLAAEVRSSDYTTDTSVRPKLVVDYTAPVTTTSTSTSTTTTSTSTSSSTSSSSSSTSSSSSSSSSTSTSTSTSTTVTSSSTSSSSTTTGPPQKLLMYGFVEVDDMQGTVISRIRSA